jgi:hypothetical protein
LINCRKEVCTLLLQKQWYLAEKNGNRAEVGLRGGEDAPLSTAHKKLFSKMIAGCNSNLNAIQVVIS